MHSIAVDNVYWKVFNDSIQLSISLFVTTLFLLKQNLHNTAQWWKETLIGSLNFIAVRAVFSIAMDAFTFEDTCCYYSQFSCDTFFHYYDFRST